MKIYEDLEQGTPEWQLVRLGKFTGSKANDLLMKPSLKGYQNLIYMLAYERLTGEPTESYVSEWMQYGVDTEPEARESYIFETGNEVQQVGFIELDENTGCSPDGLVNNDGMLEIKCVKWNVQMDYLISQKIPTNYYLQMQFNLFVSNRQWCDFYSYHPKLKAFNKRVFQDLEKFREFEERIKQGIIDVENLVERLSYA